MTIPKYDFHIHAKYVACSGCSMDPAGIAQRSAAAGATAVAITDHVNSVEMLEKHRPAPDEIRAVTTDIDVFFGVEVNFIAPDQPLPFNAELKEAYGVQFAIGGPHHHYQTEYDLPKMIDTVHRMHLATCADSAIDVLVHPYWFGYGSFTPQNWKMWDTDDFKRVPRAYAVELGQAARDSGTAIEINAGACLKDDPDWMKAYIEYLATIAEQGATFSMGSDAHGYDSLDGIARAWQAAETLGLDESRIFRPAAKPLNR